MIFFMPDGLRVEDVLKKRTHRRAVRATPSFSNNRSGFAGTNGLARNAKTLDLYVDRADMGRPVWSGSKYWPGGTTGYWIGALDLGDQGSSRTLRRNARDLLILIPDPRSLVTILRALVPNIRIPSPAIPREARQPD
jgi:hypothetical protein